MIYGTQQQQKSNDYFRHVVGIDILFHFFVCVQYDMNSFEKYLTPIRRTENVVFVVGNNNGNAFHRCLYSPISCFFFVVVLFDFRT